MPQTNEKKKEILYRVLICGLLLVAFISGLKYVFVGMQKDEEYAYSLSYRLIRGDRLLAQVWDPHQTSAFLLSFIEWIFIKITGGTKYLVLFCRFVTMLIHMGISFFVYRTMKHFTASRQALAIAGVYFAILPKRFYTPEFSLMMSWFLTLLILTLLQLLLLQDRPGGFRKILLLILSGVWMCALVLSYPSCILLFPFVLLGFILFRKSMPKGGVWIFTGTIVLIAALYVGRLLSYLEFRRVPSIVKEALRACGSHEFNAKDKFLYNGSHFLIMAGLCAATMLLSCLLVSVKDLFRHKKGKPAFGEVLLLSVILGLAAQIVLLFIPYFETHVTNSFDHYHYFLMLFGGVAAIIKGRGRMNVPERFLAFGMVLNGIGFIAVFLLTNLTIFTSVRYLTSGFAISFYFILKELPPKAETKRSLIGPVFVIAFLLNVYNLLDYSCNNGYVWNISKVQRMIRYGASKGVLCEYMTGYIFDTTHEEWEQYVEDGDTVLIWDFSTMEYLNRDVRIGTYTTLSTPTYYVDSMEEYLRMNPDKYPDVIAVSCWYGELNLETDYGHFYEWIEDRYHADTVIDGAYYRYFIRRR